jgi:hypothetical protein
VKKLFLAVLVASALASSVARAGDMGSPGKDGVMGTPGKTGNITTASVGNITTASAGNIETPGITALIAVLGSLSGFYF